MRFEKWVVHTVTWSKSPTFPDCWSFAPLLCDIGGSGASYASWQALLVDFTSETAVAENWVRIVQEHGPDVYRTAWRILGNADDADDVVQDVFLQAHQYEETNSVSNRAGLLRRLAVCRSLDRLRRYRPNPGLDDTVIVDREFGPEAQAIEKEMESALRSALCQLPDREAETFCLRYFDQLTNQQIAESLNLTSAAVATAIYKARTKLSGMLAELMRGTN